MQNFKIVTYGCTFNRGDSLKIKNLLVKEGWRYTNSENASVVIVNTCAVKLSTQTKTLYFIKDLIENRKKNQFIVVTGCLPQINKEIFEKIKRQLKPNKGIIVHPFSISKISQLVTKRNVFEYRKNVNLKLRDKSDINPFVDSNLRRTIIQISEGCNNRCAYCCTTNARGNLICFDKDQILKQINHLIKIGVREFFLTSQDLGNYNYEGHKLHDLLKEISKLEGNIKIRLGMINPDYFKKHLGEFQEVFLDERYYRFLHIPIQSASNNVLKSMKRKYDIELVNSIIKTFRKIDERFSISTDIIVGFPTEKESDFDKTKSWIEKWKPQVLNISKYSTRPNTLAKKMKQLDSKVIKKRSKIVSEAYKKYLKHNFDQWLDWSGEVFINEYHPKKEFEYMGRNNYYVPIVCQKGEMWTKQKVKIVGSLNHSLIGKKVD